MIPTGELQRKKLQRKGWRDCHLLTLHYLAVSVNSVRKKVSEAKQILKCSSFPWRKVWETWVTYTAYNFLVVLSVFCKGNHNSIFFHSNQLVIVPWKQIRVWQRIIHVIYGLFTYVCFPSSQHYASHSGHEEVCLLLPLEKSQNFHRDFTVVFVWFSKIPQSV